MSDAAARQRPADIRLALKAAGFAPVACIGKEPVLLEWQNRRDATPEEISKWPGGNSGIDTKFDPGCDIDFDDAEAAAGIEAAARDWFDGRGTIPVRFGRAPRRALLFRASVPFSKIIAKFIAPNGSKHKIEFLGAGQQIIVAGIHPDTGARYAWHADLAPWNMKRADLVEIDEAEAHAFLDYVADVLKEQFGFERASDGNGHDTHSPFETGGLAAGSNVAADPIEALAALEPADGAGINATYCRVIPELLQRGEHPDDVLKQVVDAAMAAAEREGLAWSRAQEIKRVVATILSQYRNMSILLRDYDPATGVIPSCLPGEFHEAWLRVLAAGGRPMMHFNRAGFCIKSAQRIIGGTQHHAETDAEVDVASPRSGGHDNSGTADPKLEKRVHGTFVLHPFIPFDLAALPPRQWLYGRHYQRRTVSATISPGGFGKSSLDMVELVAMATCRNLLGEQPTERLRCWFHNGEDPLEELNRRLGAICLHYGIPQEELRGWFFMTSGNEVPLRVANGYSDLKIHDLLIKCIADEIARNEIDVATLDPLVTLHSVPEQDNSKMDAVVRIFAGIADAQDCAIELAHHTRKLAPGVTDYVANDIRGASAIKDAVRAARVLNQMTEQDAEAVGVPEHERTSYFRVDRVKGNNAPPAKAVWRRFVNVELPNTDEVGVIAPWDFPGQGATTPEMTAAEQAADSVFMQLLVRLTMEGRTVSDKAGTNYAPHVFSQEREAKAARIGKRPLADAMRRLFANKRIRIEQSERKGRVAYCLVAA
jgi:RecA-family ATPase